MRAMFWAAQRTHDVDTALDMCRRLIAHYAKQSGPSTKKALDQIRRTPVSNLTCLDSLEAPGKPVIDPVPGRLLYVLNYSLPQVSNGYATRGQGMALGMQECGIDVICLSRPGFPLDLKPTKKFTPSDNVDGVTYLHDPEPILLGTSNMSTYVSGAADVIEERIRELRPQAVMAASNFNNALPALIAARRMGIPFWYEVRGFWEITRLSKEPEIEWTFNYQLQRAFENLVACHSDRVFTLTQPMREELVERGVEEDRIALVPNSCDPSRFSARPYDTALARRLGIPEGVPVIGYIGSFAPYEGLENLARACAQLRKDGHEFRLLLVGGETGADSSKGPVTLGIERIAKEEGLTDWLIMTGRVPHEEVEAHYSLIDVAPFPRRSQPVTEMVSPLKPLEALAMEKAVAVSSLRALHEMVTHNETGLIFEKENLTSFTDVLARLLKDKDLRTRLGKAGRKWVVEERTWARTAEKVAQALEVPDSRVPFATLIQQKGFTDAEQVLYADIDLNTVDGSAIWMSSMASILASGGKTILISKNPIRRNTIIDNILNRQNVLILTPGNVDLSLPRLDMPRCIILIRQLDQVLPKLRTIIIRGIAAANELMSDRQFYRRVYPYLTDLYTHTESGIEIKPDASASVDMLARQSAGLLVQTPELEALMRQMTDFPFKAIPLPPPVPDALIEQIHKPDRSDKTIRIGYAGKIAPQWGIQQLVSWVEILRAEGLEIEVTIIGDKIAGAATPEANKAFRQEINDALDRINARRLGALNRADVMREMQQMDFAWCWRPADFEKHTLELSTKLVESIVAGIPCVTYPSKVNQGALGREYTFFARDVDEFRKLLTGPQAEVPAAIRTAVHERHSISGSAVKIAEATRAPSETSEARLCLAAYAPKFVQPYYSRLKAKGESISYDAWAWGGPIDETRTRRQMVAADIILCEWGLANAVWYSNNLPAGKRLIVRLHAQEVRGKAVHFGEAMNVDRVEKFIFVADWVRRKAIEMFGWPEEKTCVIPNFVLEDEYLFTSRDFTGTVRLGMVGIVPQQKRFDRAIDLAEELVRQGQLVELHIKGARPENIPFMQDPARAKELEYYKALSERVEDNPALRGKVHFHDWGNDVAAFYDNVDHILSPSESESFHYALADGVLSGCHPLIWERQDAGRIFSPDWLVPDTAAAAERIIAFRAKSAKERDETLKVNRALVVERYGSAHIYAELDKVLFGES
ncbi:glycosyltransferase [Pseudophaeobacter sp. C1-32P7]|uniref:glycosyltransferase n=1 Tax=Pseudophaeobacter sp. C1-32P7 TaxID=3098142 RepID=UPI0034D3E5A0